MPIVPFPAPRRPLPRRAILATAILAALCAAPAGADTVRIGSRVIVDGDSEAQVRAVAGEPQVVKPAPAPKTAKGDKSAVAKGEQWFYRVDNKTIAITLRGGVVTAIATTHGGASGSDAAAASSNGGSSAAPKAPSHRGKRKAGHRKQPP